MKKDTKVRIGRRLKIIEGQVKGVQKMVEEDTYCVDIITQIEAVRSALAGVGHAVLENHLSTHVIEQVRAGQEKKVLEEVMKVYKLSNKNT